MEESNRNQGNPARSRYAFAALLSLCLFGLVLFVFSDRSAVSRLGLSSCQAEPAGKGERAKEPEEAQGRLKPVTVYVTSWCPACRMTTEYLTEKKIPFTVKDVEKNPEYYREMVDKVGGYRGVPVLDIDGKILLGFNPYVFEELMK